METILIIEDSKSAQLILQSTLNMYSTKVASTLAEARTYLNNEKDFKIILIDLNLPDGNGLDLLQELKIEKSNLQKGIFIISSESSIEAKLTAFNLGADVYISKPYNPLELQARIQAKIEKLNLQFSNKEFLEIGNLIIDTNQVKIIDLQTQSSLNLTTLEYKIIFTLVKNKSRYLSREEIKSSVWGKDLAISLRNIDTHIAHIRKKLNPHFVTIESQSKLGYRIINIEKKTDGSVHTN